jgi:hypothetical protein
MPRTRQFFQIRIGGGNNNNNGGEEENCTPSRVADVVLHIRRQDLAWFENEDDDDEEVMDHVLELLQTDIVPRMDHDRYKHEIALGPQGIPILDDNKNNKAKTATTTTTTTSRPIKRAKKLSKQELAERQRLERERAKREQQDNVSKEAYYAANDKVKIVYKWEACRGGAVLVPRRSEQQQSQLLRQAPEEKAASTAAAAASPSWIECAKFSKRLLLWCYPATANDVPAAGGEGLLRPELIPLADLFRSPTTK